MSEQIDWSKAPEGADKYNAHNRMFYKGERPDLQVFIHDQWRQSAIIKSNELFVYRQTTPSWSGEGLPPVGVVCEMRHESWQSNNWSKVTVKYASTEYFITEDGAGEQHWHAHSVTFRPIRTQEQIAADERESQIVAIHDAIVTSVKVTLGQCDSWRKVAEMVYSAGFKRE